MQPFSLDINDHKMNSKVTDIKSIMHHNIFSTSTHNGQSKNNFPKQMVDKNPTRP